MQKKTKRIIIISILIMIFAIILFLLMRNKTSKISQIQQDTSKATVYTKIGEQEIDISNLIEQNPMPKISAGMIPVKQDGEYWTITDKTDSTWYNYNGGKPAYIMLNDGIYQSEEYYKMPNKKKLAEDNKGTQISINDTDTLGSIYMWIPRFAYDKNKNIVYLKDGCVISGNYTIPDFFSYELDRKKFSLSGVWAEYNTIDVSDITKTNNELCQKIEALNKGEIDTVYGLLAETKAKSVAELVQKSNTISVDTDTTNMRTNAIQAYVSNFKNQILFEETNGYRTILQVIDTTKIEPITSINATYNANLGQIIVNVNNSINGVSKIVDEKCKELIYENSEKTIANTGDELIGNGVYSFYIFDELGNIAVVKCKVTESNVFMIKDRESLCLFRDAVNSGQTNAIGIQVADVTDLNEGKYIIDSETGDITFDSNAEQWSPIGTERYKFKGKYYGNGYTINGIYNNQERDYTGFFGYVTGDGQVFENINVKNSYIKGGSDSAGIVSYVYYAKNLTISNCSFEGKISGKGYTAGIVAEIYIDGTLSIDNCISKGKISGGLGTGGIAGYISKNSSATSMVIQNCKNYANVSGGEYSGGVCGYFQTYNVNESKVEYCCNFGNLNSSNSELGGVIGYTYGVKSIYKCYNKGDVNSNSIYIGGIVGSTNSINISECYNTGKVKASDEGGGIFGTGKNVTISNCYNSGEVNGTYSGGICGEARNVKCDYCYNSGNVTGGLWIGGIFGYSDKNSAFNYTYNNADIVSTAVWTSNASRSDVGGIGGATEGQVNYSFNIGNISGKVSFVGAILGQNMNGWGKISDCGYLIGTASVAVGADYTTTGGSDSGVTKYSSIEEMPGIMSVINHESKFTEDIQGINRGYPILAWQVE